MQTGTPTDMFEDFDYSARGFDCNEGDFEDRYIDVNMQRCSDFLMVVHLVKSL